MMASPGQIALWQSWLTAAQTAYHQLMIGLTAVEVAVDGATFSTRFAKPDADKLFAYITRLEALIDGQRTSGAIGVYF